MTENRNKILVKAFGLLMAVSVILGVAAPAAAFSVQTLNDVKTQGDFIVGPGKVELYMAPGEKLTKEILVTNRIGRKMTFNLTAEDFKGSFDVNEPVILLGGEKGPYSLKDYIKPEQNEFDLENGQRAVINVEVSLPADAEPGGRYGALVVNTKPDDAKRSSASVISRLGVLFYIRVKGDVVEKSSFSEFKTKDDKKMYSKGPIPMDMIVRNDGNVHITPNALVEVTNMFGSKVGTIKVDPWFVLPNSMKLREVNWEANGILFGKYTAKATVTLGSGTTETKEASFWVIPWKLIITLFVIIVLILLVIAWLKKNFQLTRKGVKGRK